MTCKDKASYGSSPPCNLKDAPAASKNAVCRRIRKSGRFESVSQKRKVAETSHRIDRNRPKIVLNPYFPAYSKSPWKGANMYMWLYGLNMPCKNILALQTSHTVRPGGRTFRDCFSKIIVFVFLRTFELTTLLLKSLYLRLHCYTQELEASLLGYHWKWIDLSDTKIQIRTAPSFERFPGKQDGGMTYMPVCSRWVFERQAGVLQCAAVCCIVLQCVAMCCTWV